ncbi:hypothetical protein [Microcystis aeruginosa]|uniref:Uncharacterized protein n=1 Tax=Microcystis sp. PCC 9811 TaxID=2099381 RepID=A0A2P0ZGU9_9CHRO|nr:hypothetical protein [Microcystis aeruginosa]AVH79692.1 hypothetical protein [Microcystis sp. PCC 9811]MDB9421119.1 hypothetical protein [Microcystis aeruginosa CS-563/04]
MANIKVNDLQPLEVEFMYLTQFEVENVVGGGWFKKLTGISTPKFLKNIDDWVNENVQDGWLGVAIGIGTIASGGQPNWNLCLL